LILGPGQRFRTHPDVIGRDFDGAEILVHLGTNTMFELDPTASRIFRWLVDGLGVDEIALRLAAEFESEDREIAADVDTIVSDLIRENLVVARDGRSIEIPTRPIEPMNAGPRGPWASFRPGARIAPESCGCETAESATGDRVILMGRLEGRGDGAAAIAARWRDDERGTLDGLRGAFALAVWERSRDRLVLVRDAIGMSPCFYRWDGGLLSWSTSIDPLLEGHAARPNRPLLAEYLEDRVTPAQAGETFFDGVSRLPPGHRMNVAEGEPAIERYFQVALDDGIWATRAEAEELPDRLRAAVRRALDDGADSIALSGGFDSIALATLMRELEPSRKLTAISLTFPGTRHDESDAQVAVANRLGLVHELEAVELGGEAFVDTALSESATSPSPVLSPWQWLYGRVFARTVSQGGRRIVFGTGGDEMFIVDPVYASDLIVRRDLRGVYAFLRAWQNTSQLPSREVAQDLLWSSGLRRAAARFARSTWSRFATRASTRSVDPELGRALAERAGTVPAPTGDSYTEALRSTLDSAAFLNEIDQANAWAEGLHLRMLLPYYDRDLVDLALRLPPTSLYTGGFMKAPLRRLVAEKLPGLALPRKKMDFTAGGDAVLRQAGRKTWLRLRGARALAELGVVDLRKAATIMEEFFDGKGGWLRPWLILSSEVWLRNRFDMARS
jgi:asparagine synthase (glutamine-hydrolysing)